MKELTAKEAKQISEKIAESINLTTGEQWYQEINEKILKTCSQGGNQMIWEFPIAIDKEISRNVMNHFHNLGYHVYICYVDYDLPVLYFNW